MMQRSAGILLHRYQKQNLQVLLVHPGGPFWLNKDIGAWSIPKGLYDEDEEPLDAAKREFTEETGFTVDGDFHDLGELKQPSGKVIHAWALTGDIDTSKLISNTFELEWPPHSGKVQSFPEVDAGAWFDIAEARMKILPGQVGFLDGLIALLAE